MKRTFILNHKQARQRAIDAIHESGDGYVVTVSEPKRSLCQNRLLWVLLNEISEQVNWHGQKLSPDNWKDVATAALKRQQVVPGIDGGFVVLGTSTSKMTKFEMNELIDFLYAFGAQKGVQFGEPDFKETSPDYA